MKMSKIELVVAVQVVTVVVEVVTEAVEDGEVVKGERQL